MPIIEKVTAFITRPSRSGHDLLLFEHLYAGIQIPAGTVDDGETPEHAVLHETAEETGLVLQSVTQYLDCTDRQPHLYPVLVLDRDFARDRLSSKPVAEPFTPKPVWHYLIRQGDFYATWWPCFSTLRRSR